MKDSDHEKLVQALNTVIGSAMGDQFEELDSKLSTRLGSVKKETTESIDSMRDAIKELASKSDASVVEARKQITEAMDSKRQEIETKTADSLAVAKRETTDSIDKLEHSVLTRTAEMIGRLSKVEENQESILDDLAGQTSTELEKDMQVRVLAVKSELDRDVSELRRELANLRDELKLQMQATERVSAFLNSMANVFSVSPREAQGERTTPPGSDPSQFSAGSRLTREEVDHAIERALGEEWAPGKTVEMQNPLFPVKRK